MYIQDPADQSLFVTFRSKVFINEAKSLEDGIPVTTNKDYVTMIQRGAGKTIYDGPAKKDHINRFPEQYRAFKEGKNQEVIEGIPIEQLPGITQEQVVVCKHLKLHTIEQVANIIDAQVKRLGVNGRRIVQACQKYVSGSSHLDNKLKEQEKEIEELKNQLKALVDKPKRNKKAKQGVIDEFVDNSAEGNTSE